MADNIMDEIRRSLEEKRNVVRECCEVEAESPEFVVEAQTHLQVIDASLQKLDEGALGVCSVCHGTVDDALLEMDYTTSVCLDDFSSQERRALKTNWSFHRSFSEPCCRRKFRPWPAMILQGTTALHRSSR